MGSKPKAPKPAPAPAQLVDLGQETSGRSNFEQELKRLKKKKQSVYGGETGGYQGSGGYGGSTNLG